MKLTRFKDCKTINIPADKIVRIFEGYDQAGERAYPYSEIYVYDKSDVSGYIERVVESKDKIIQLIEEEGGSYEEQNNQFDR